MPDPEKELMLKIIKDDLRKFNERITELTQKIRDTKISNSAKMINQNKIIADYTLLKERIEKLEQWKKQHLDDLHKDILQPWLESHNTKIAELSKRMGDTFINQKVFFIKEIDKLKEYIDNHIKEIHTRSHNQANKIEKELASLREEIQNGDIMVLEPLMKDITELKEWKKRQLDHNIQISNILSDFGSDYSQRCSKLEEVLREHMSYHKSFHKPNDKAWEYFHNQYKKLSGEQSVIPEASGLVSESGVGSSPTQSALIGRPIDSKPESCQTCLYENNMKDDNTCGMCNPNTPQSHWTPKNNIFFTNICERCIYEYTKDDFCYKHHEQYNLSHKITTCSDFEQKEPSDDELEDDFIDSITGYREEMEIQKGLILLKRGELEKWYDIFLHDDQMKHLEALSEMEKCLEAKNDA